MRGASWKLHIFFSLQFLRNHELKREQGQSKHP